MDIYSTNYRGKWFHWARQEWNDDCGPTCVAMAKSLLKGGGVDMNWLRRMSKAKMVSPKIERKVQALGRSVGNTGTAIQDLINMARDLGLKARFQYHWPDFDQMDALRTCSYRRLIICQMDWDRGGSHYVLVARVEHDGTVIILDPYMGIQTSRTIPLYTPRDKKGARSVGHFSGYDVIIET